jgi:hypothetical protein
MGIHPDFGAREATVISVFTPDITSQQQESSHMKLDIKAFAITCGLVWGLGLFALTWWVIAFDGPSTGPTIIGRLYRGYTITPVGSLIGLVWGFFGAPGDRQEVSGASPLQ